jgi:hypothetical protein
MRKLSKTKILTAVCILGSGLAAGNASAAICDSASTSTETSLQDVFNGITTGGSSSVTANTDCLADSNDSNWSISGSGLSGTTMIIEIAGQAGSNTFGIYDSTNSSISIELFDGAASAGSQVVMSIKNDGSVEINLTATGTVFAGNSFGFYMDTINGTFYSDTSLNGDLFDHMLAYQGTGDEITVGNNAPGVWSANEYILAWEDLPVGSSDKDYNDMVLIVESVNPAVVPVPAAVWLFGSGLLGLVGVARRKKA